MKTRKVSRYYCDFCRKGRFSKKWMEQHERTCHKNPDRVPYEGELSYVSATGKLVNFGTSDNLPDGMSWIEWVPHDKMPKYWPGEGKIFHDGQWHDVPGYRCEIPRGAHGCAGGPAPFDVWPTHGKGGTPLNQIPTKSRWEVLDECLPVPIETTTP